MSRNADYIYKQTRPVPSLSDLVESFWMLQNSSDQDKSVVILPDGRIDLFLSESTTESFHMSLMGLGTHPESSIILAQSTTFAISFKPLATEYLLRLPLANLLNRATNLPVDFWGFSPTDLTHFDRFIAKATVQLQSLLRIDLDPRKKALFEWLYRSNGALSVGELSDRVGWSSRQINRYFTREYGLSLKGYCSILRFRASFNHLKEGKLYPEGAFSDQPHFIREVKKLAGVNPKKLSQNQDDRFIQFSTLSVR